jgi:hypothetical protein
MKLAQSKWQAHCGWHTLRDDGAVEPNLVLLFAGPRTLDDGMRFDELRRRYPSAHIVGCTTSGEIIGGEVDDGTVAATAVEFKSTTVHVAKTFIPSIAEDSAAAGRRLGAMLPKPGLRAIFLLSDGTRVNGSELVRGLRATLGGDVIITGGLAGDGADFGTTRVGADANPEPGNIVAIGFYGAALTVGFGSFGGWDAVGPNRIITRATGNVLYEINGESALTLYKKYLGEAAAMLPASALLFPLRVFPQGRTEDEGIVRTVIGIKDEEDAMIFAGDVPEGSACQLMLGDFDHLVAGAGRAAMQAMQPDCGLAILVSCVGRKLLLGQRVAEEVDAVTDVLGESCGVTGFYSYGEIAPHGESAFCDLHNQTMTITTFAER